ncbi:hypothetical protein STIUS_v1c05240 [Spiroplasma sp. TIUS-1]|uniref:hypothetical protein n=1 Tax=Spiroplasma sp. TIUS-1 TaxID=216963 RepID=UPI001396D2B9|nr:hypothetical protein [Spiroplasma sp. TIUS-1]QHX36078.1 hypothetical protein STIUS_v1c05240 [Spiroplasma sp. TIUS-1]
MKLTIFKYFFKSTLKSKVLWITSVVMIILFVTILSIFTLALQGDSDMNNGTHSLMRIILYIIGIVQITIVNLLVFSKYFSRSITDGTMSLEKRSGISSTVGFWQRILLSKVWSIGSWFLFTLFIIIFGIISPSPVYSLILFNLSIGFIVLVLFDLILSGVLAILSTFSLNILLGVFGCLMAIFGMITPVMSMLWEMGRSGIGDYSSSRQIFRDYEKYMIAKEVRDIEQEYPDGFVHEMLISFKDLRDSISLTTANSKTPQSDKNIYTIGIAGLLTEFSGDGIEINDGIYKYTNDDYLNSPLFKYLLEVKKLQPMGDSPYNKSNDFGKNIWTNSIYYTKNSVSANEKLHLGLDIKGGFNELINKLNSDSRSTKELIRFNNLIERIIKSSFITFDREPEETSQWNKWNFFENAWVKDSTSGLNSEDNDWLSSINISLGGRTYQTGFIKALDAAINVPFPAKSNTKIDLDTYYRYAKVQLYSNPWVMFNQIMSNNYFGDDLVGNRINENDFSRPFSNQIIKSDVKDDGNGKDEIFITYDESNFISITIEGKMFYTSVAILCWFIFSIVILGIGYLIFIRKMKI